MSEEMPERIWAGPPSRYCVDKGTVLAGGWSNDPGSATPYVRADAHERASIHLLDSQGQLRPLRAIEDEAILRAVQHCGGCLTKTARHLGIGRSTLYRRLSEIKQQVRGRLGE